MAGRSVPLEDIQASPRNALRAQRVDQGLGIHDRPAPDVDEIAVRTERGEHVRADEVPRPAPPGAAATRKSAHVASSMKFSEIAIGEPATAARLW